MMTKGRRCPWAVMVLLMSLSQAGCRRSVPRGTVPAGFPRRYFDEVVAIADKTVLKCDEIVAQPDCYDHNGGPGPIGDPAKVVPLPANPLGGAPALKLLFARCLHMEVPLVYCSSGPRNEPPDVLEICGEVATLPGWRGLADGRDGERIDVSSSAKCPQPWIVVDVMRYSAKHNLLALKAFFKL